MSIVIALLVGFAIGRLRFYYCVKEINGQISGPYLYQSAARYCDYLNKSGKPAKVIRTWRFWY